MLFGVDVGLFTKSSVTHFERDKDGNVVEVTRNGRVVDPEELRMKSVKDLEREYHKKHPIPKQKSSSVFRDIVSGFSGMTPQERKAAHKRQLEELRLANLPLKRRLEIQKMQRERERLMKELHPQPTGFVMTPWGMQPVYHQPKKKTKKKGKKK